MNRIAAEFCATFGLETPVVNAPMANIAGGALASAVSSGGGLGLIGGGYGVSLPKTPPDHDHRS